MIKFVEDSSKGLSSICFAETSRWWRSGDVGDSYSQIDSSVLIVELRLLFRRFDSISLKNLKFLVKKLTKNSKFLVITINAKEGG